MKRVVAICLSLAVALGGFCLTGCAQGDEGVIRNGMSQELNMLKNIDSETIDDLLDATPYNLKYGAQAMGLDLEDYLQAYFTDFDYQIGQISVDGDEATVEVTLKMKSAAAVGDAVEAYSESLTAEQLQEVGMGMYSGEIPSWFGEGIIEAVRAVPNSETEVLQIPVKKTGNTWSYEEAANDIIEAAVAGQ